MSRQNPNKRGAPIHYYNPIVAFCAMFFGDVKPGQSSGGPLGTDRAMPLAIFVVGLMVIGIMGLLFYAGWEQLQ